MIRRFSHSNITWFDVIHPTMEDVRDIVLEAGIPTEFTTDLISPTPRTESHFRKHALKITLDFPIVKRTDINHPHEIKFIATKSHLITIRFEDITAVHSFGKQLEVINILKHGGKTATGANLFLALLNYIYAGLDQKLDYLESQIQGIEENIFKDNEKEMLVTISEVSRRLISFRHTIEAHASALEELETGILTSFGKSYTNQLSELESNYAHTTRRTTSLISTIGDLRETNTELLSMKQNEVMKIFTIMAFITFPLTLFTSLFGMNTSTTPIIGVRHDFWVIVGIMIIVSIGFFAFFKYKKWI